MRPITNILLVLALFCYVFLPFYDISLMGTVTGLGFTAGTISQTLSLDHVILALLPFITCFGAIALNCLKKRWWVHGTIALIILGIWFFVHTGNPHDYGLYVLSLLSAIISLLPFKFNETIEKAVDDTFEDGRRHVRNEFNRLENNLHKPHKAKQQPHSPTPTPPAIEDKPEPPVEDKEDPSRFMPKQ